MPELPEVETTRRGIAAAVSGATIEQVVVRNGRLRWPVPEDLPEQLAGARIQSLQRRAKYLLFDVLRADGRPGWLIVHLGMTGSLRILAAQVPARPHEHVDLVLATGQLLRLRDPRRFGAVLWWEGDIRQHALLRHLGPEPLSDQFNAEWWQQKTRQRRQAVKLVLMDQEVVVGVGNIYANEALFRAGILPQRLASSLRPSEVQRLLDEVRAVLQEAIAAGGSTLRDYVGGDGAAGYFQQNYFVYGRADEPCRRCGALLALQRLGGRSTFYCTHCQQ